MIRFALLVLLSVLAPSIVAAQSYPSKPIHIILPYVPGGIIDTAGRHLALRLSESLGQSVVADNRPGAGGVVGTDVVARSAPDGYTILLNDPALVSNPSLLPDVPYELSALQPVSVVGSSPAVIVASPHLPVTSFSELLAYAQANPGKLNFASAGIGTAPHLAAEMIKLRTGISMQHVPYRGIGAAYPDVQRDRPVVFLHEPWLGFFGRRDVVCLWTNAGRRELGLVGFDDPRARDDRLAFVRRDEPKRA